MKKLLLALAVVTSILGGTALFRAQSTGYVNWSNTHMAYNNADFTDGGSVTTLQNIPRLTFSLPAGQTGPFWIDCQIFYSQATQVADSFGLQFSNSPTNVEASGYMFTNATTSAAGPAANITNTSATAVLTGTPAVATVLNAHFWALVEQANNATDTVVNVSVSQATAANVVVIKRGSVCQYHSMN